MNLREIESCCLNCRKVVICKVQQNSRKWYWNIWVIVFNSVEYYLCNGDDDGHKNIKKAVGLINKMTTWPVHHIFGTCLCHHYISMLQVKFDLRLKLFYLCWFFNFLCLLGLEDKQTYESTCNLGQKVLRIFHFLNHRMPILWIWQRYGTPPLTPPWSKFFSRDQKRSSRASTG